MRKDRRLGLSRRTWIIILIMVLAAGFLIYSTILLLLNRFMHPADFAGLPNYMELIERRLEIRLFAEKVHGFCAAIALLGGCMVVYDFTKPVRRCHFESCSLCLAELQLDCWHVPAFSRCWIKAPMGTTFFKYTGPVFI